MGGRQFTKIGLPALAIFASPHDTGAAMPDPEFDRFDEAVTKRQARAFDKGCAGSARAAMASCESLPVSDPPSRCDRRSYKVHRWTALSQCSRLRAK